MYLQYVILIVFPVSSFFHNILKYFYWFTYSFINKSFIHLFIYWFLYFGSEFKTWIKDWSEKVQNITVMKLKIFAVFSWWPASSFSLLISLSLHLFHQLLSWRKYVQSLLFGNKQLCGIFFKLNITTTG